jgi:hypothetical protein
MVPPPNLTQTVVSIRCRELPEVIEALGLGDQLMEYSDHLQTKYRPSKICESFAGNLSSGNCSRVCEMVKRVPSFLTGSNHLSQVAMMRFAFLSAPKNNGQGQLPTARAFRVDHDGEDEASRQSGIDRH